MVLLLEAAQVLLLLSAGSAASLLLPWRKELSIIGGSPPDLKFRKKYSPIKY